MTKRWRWLDSTYDLQENFFGVDFEQLKGEQLANYITWNVTALTVELGEFLQEVRWKPWASPRGDLNRERALAELVDVAHFLANLVCSLEVTDDEFEDAYRRKQKINAQRQREGYDGVSSKCPGCYRALDELDELVIDDSRFCPACGIRLGAASDSSST